MSRDVNTFESNARALERDAKAAKEEIERLVQALAALPTEVKAAIRAQIESERNRLEAIAAQADRALDDRQFTIAAHLEMLDRQLEEAADQLERRRIEKSKSEAEAAYEAGRYHLESARTYAQDGIDLSVETMARYGRALD